LSERGLPSVPPAESIKAMMPEKYWWPINDVWGLHDLAQGGVKPYDYRKTIAQSFGEPTSLEDFAFKAQMVNYEYHRAMFEGWANILGNGNSGGILMWMSISAWPSLVWQAYDYYFEVGGAYFGIRKATELLHLLWNPANDQVTVVNHRQASIKNLEAEVAIYNLDGQKSYVQRLFFDAAPARAQPIFKIPFASIKGLSEVHFIKLSLLGEATGRRAGAKKVLLADNFYWRSLKEGNYQALNQLPRLSLEAKASAQLHEGTYSLLLQLKNPHNVPAFMIRLKVLQGEGKERVLPVHYEDNYLSLMPLEEKQLKIEFQQKDLRQPGFQLVTEGWNIHPQKVPLSGK
jgi:hypothetical protein